MLWLWTVLLIEKTELDTLVAQTTHFDFHSEALINLHHFLYANALLGKGEQVEKREEANKWHTMMAVELTAAERETWDAAVAYYQNECISKDLLFNGEMVRIKNSLMKGDFDKAMLSPELAKVLEQSTPIYRKYWWPEHDRMNRVWVANVRTGLLKHERAMVSALTTAFADSWLAERCRIDVSVYGGLFGAYTTTRPTHVILTSTRKEETWAEQLELVFHESSHGVLGGRRGVITERMNHLSVETGHPVPRGLWHGILFYTVGWATRQQLAFDGFEYQMTMLKKGIFKSFHTALRNSWEPYLRGDGSMDEALTQLLEELSVEK